MTDTRFGIQFVVTRNGKPITDVITVENTPISLHIDHSLDAVWEHQVQVLAKMMIYPLMNVNALADVVPDTRPVGLQLPQEGVLKRTVGVPTLKRANRALLALVERLAAYNAKRGQ